MPLRHNLRHGRYTVTDTNTKLLLHFEGANASTTFTDSSPTPKTVTPVGNAQISTTQFKYGSASGAYDGTGDYCTVPASTDFDLWVGDGTAETFFYISNGATNRSLLGGGVDVANRWLLYIRSDGNLAFFTEVGGVPADRIVGTGPATLTWHHAAVVKSGTTFTLYLNGVSQGTYTGSAYATGSQGISIGSHFSSNNFTWWGYLDEVRLSKGIARYTANFTPPSGPFS